MANLQTHVLDWYCPECGCGTVQCARYSVTCQCCGNQSFIFGDDAQSKFYNYELSCPECGTSWEAHNSNCPAYAYPDGTYQGGNDLTSWGDVSYRYLHKNLKVYRIYDYLLTAQMYTADGRIVDNCGNVIEVEVSP